MKRELEAIIWCPSCKEDKYTVFRVPTGNSGIYHHETEPPDSAAYRCDVCNAVLERKP